MHELFPKEEPLWWKQAVADRDSKAAQKGGSSNHSSPACSSSSVLPGWEEVVDPETLVVSVQRVRGGRGAETGVDCVQGLQGLQGSTCRRAVLGGSAALWAQLQAVRGGFSPWGVTWPADAEEWDDSGERRLNVADSDWSFECARDTLPYELYDEELGITGDVGASSRAREMGIRKVGNGGREGGVAKETGVLGSESDEPKKAVSGEQVAMSDVGGDEEELVLQDEEDFDVATKVLEDEESPLLQFLHEQGKKRAASSGEHPARDGERHGEGGGRREKGDFKGGEMVKIVGAAGGGGRQRKKSLNF